MELLELLIDDLDDGRYDIVSPKDAVIDYISLDTVVQKKEYHNISVPTCSCDYLNWTISKGGIKYPKFMNELKPTKIDQNGQCVYCHYYAFWKKIDLRIYESAEIPFWTKPEWYNKPDENN